MAAAKRSRSRSAQEPEETARNTFELFVPGRVCLFGEHSDWAGAQRRLNSDLRPGACIVAGTDHGIKATVSTHKTLKLRSVTHDGEERSLEIPMCSKELFAVAAEGGFFSYACGVAAQVAISHSVDGLSIDFHTATLPHGKGLSSSAAVCVLVARAFNRAYGMQLTTRGEMELAYQGEISTPSRCGRMDQCVAFGPGSASRMGFDADRVEAEPLAVGAAIHMLLIDLGAGKDTTTILQELGRGFPFPKSEPERQLANLLGDYNLAVTQRAAVALAAGDAAELGRLMTEAQAEFDQYARPMCPSQLTSPQLHALLEHQPLAPLIFGGKGVGSQGDGTAQLVCRTAEAATEAAHLIERAFPRMSCMKLTLGGDSVAVGQAPEETVSLDVSLPASPVSPRSGGVGLAVTSPPVVTTSERGAAALARAYLELSAQEQLEFKRLAGMLQ
jgi:galactokinase